MPVLPAEDVSLTPQRLGALRRFILLADKYGERGWRTLRTWLGRNRPVSILPYRGYANQTGVWIGGRILADRPPGAPRPGDTRWCNLRRMLRRLHSNEVPYAPVCVRLGDRALDLKTDEEGYFSAFFDLRRPLTPQGLWFPVDVRVAQTRRGNAPCTAEVALRAQADVLVPPRTARFAVISDLDDTVLQSDMTHWFTAVRTLLFHNALTRRPLEGVREFYCALHRGVGGRETPERNPIFYVSSSAWNLYDLLVDFLAINRIPAGPVLLRDIGLDASGRLKSGPAHKRRMVQHLLEVYPRLPFVLIGDSGQHDPEIYLDIVRRFAPRICGVYIREVLHDRDPRRALRARACAEEAAHLGVPMLLVRDSLEAARHAAEVGLIAHADLDDVAAARQVDHVQNLAAASV